MIVNVFEARNKLSRLIEAARSGELVVIANRGKPVVKLVPVEEDSGGTGDVDAILDWFYNDPLPPLQARSREEIDAYLDAERSSWD